MAESRERGARPVQAKLFDAASSSGWGPNRTRITSAVPTVTLSLCEVPSSAVVTALPPLRAACFRERGVGVIALQNAPSDASVLIERATSFLRASVLQAAS